MSEKNPNIMRRTLIAAAVLSAAGVGASSLRFAKLLSGGGAEGMPVKQPEIVRKGGAMPYRRFGRTGLEVSELGFGAWGIGGAAYGAVSRGDSLDALARAEELGCNFVDTAMGYGESELVLGEFLKGRRDKWVLATKYSGQDAGMTATLEQQLQRLQTEAVDLYQIHWVPTGKDAGLWDELYRIKKSGKARFVGVSLYTIRDIDFVLDSTDIDSVMVAFSLLDPFPFLAGVERLRASGIAVIVRSVLKEGFLTGKYGRDATFPDPNDNRHKLTRAQIEDLVGQAEQFRFLEQDAGSLLQGAIRYPLSFPEVSTVILGTKSVRQADSNFGAAAGGRLSAESLVRIRQVQQELKLGSTRQRWALAFRQLLGR